MKNLGLLLLIILFNSQISFGQSVRESYDIGYKSQLYQDCSRANMELVSLDSKNNCRTISTSIWYPSDIKDFDSAVHFGDFLTTIELNEKQDYNPKDSVVKSSDKFADYYNISETHFLNLLNYPTQSFFNSEVLPNKYPLVIYIPGMNGFSFENHMLCEEIAKQGNVVISFNSKGSDKRWMEPNTIDYENQIRDVQFIIAKTTNLSYVDNSKICLIGHSIGGYVNVLAQIRDNRITSLVSLDGSIIHDFNRSSEFVYKDLSKVNCPFLSVSTRGFDEAMIYLDSMEHADRYYYQTSALRHRDFKSITYLLPATIDSLQFKNYLNLNNLIVSFIDKVNNGRQDKFQKLSDSLTNSGFVKTSYLHSTPDFSDFRLMVSNANFVGLSGIYKNTVAQYPKFIISINELYDWGNNLRFYGYLNQAIQVYRLLIDLHPDYISGYNGLARTLLLQNKDDEAIEVYKLALKIEPNNESLKRKLNKLTVEKSN